MQQFVMPLLRRFRLQKTMFSMMYRQGITPWDTGISPPELVECIEGPNHVAAGKAVDIGCGTGTNVLYMARHGWQATGIDFAQPAIDAANKKLAQMQGLSGSARFFQGDATQLDALQLGTGYALLLDMGCFHGIPEDRRKNYVEGVAHLAATGATFMLYAHARGDQQISVTPATVPDIFAPYFSVERIVKGTYRGGESAWFWLKRTAYDR